MNTTTSFRSGSDKAGLVDAAGREGEEEYYSTTEAAQRLHVSNTTVQIMVERGELKAWKTRGGHRRIARESVERLAHLRGLRASARQRGDERASLSVLVADDDAALRALYEKTIGDWGLPVQLLVARDGMEALLMIERNRPDILIADLHMRPMDGFELLRMFRQHPEFDRMVVIAATGLDESEIEARGGVPKGTIVYRKPVQFEKLRGFIESALLRKELE